MSSSGISLCFVVDCTYSQGRTLGSLAKILPSLVAETQALLRSHHGTLLPVNVSFVGYSDIECEVPVVVQDWTDLQSLIRSIIARETQLGKDFAEDLASGLDAALNLNWPEGKRIVLLIADAPGHGLLPRGSKGSDHFPIFDQNKVPWEERYNSIFEKSLDLNINYVIVPIDHVPEKPVSLRVLKRLIKEFKKHLGKESIIVTEPHVEVELTRLLDSVSRFLS
ncbi:hypothetical protein GEMRC1_000265 [Eukaryota sp. GEM-RC1]